MMSDTASSFPLEWLRQTSPYINTHRGKTFVVWLSDELLERELFKNLVHDLTLLSHLGVRLVLVHGMRAQINLALATQGVEAKFANPSEVNEHEQVMRITTASMLPALQSVSGQLRCHIESLFTTGLPNTPMSGSRVTMCSGNFVIAKPFGVRSGVDYKHTGEVRKIRIASIKQLLDLGMIVLLQPLGYSPTGELFNLHAEDVATRAAIDLNADKLIFVHDQSDDLADAMGGMREISIKAQEFPYSLPSELARVRSAVQNASLACHRGVARCHIVSSLQDGALLKELFTRDGSGLLIDAGDYDLIRTANTGDVAGIKALIQPLINEGILRKRSEQDLERSIDDFYVAEREGSVIASASLTIYAEQAELGCLAVHPDFRASGKATDMLCFLIKEARAKGCTELFALSTRSGDWFREHGFQPGNLNEVPVDDRRIASKRGSKAYVLDLTGS